jgi:hypothetical protein
MIRADLRTYLLAQSSITTLIGQRLYLSRIPLPGTYPCVSYRRVSGGHFHDLQGSRGYCEAAIEIEVWSDDSEEVESVGDAIRQKLQGFVGTMGSTTVKRVTLDDEQDSFLPPIEGSDTGVHRTTFRYTIGFGVTIPTY